MHLIENQPNTHSQRVREAGRLALPDYVAQDREDRLQLAKARIEEGLQARGYEFAEFEYNCLPWYKVAFRLECCPKFIFEFCNEHNDQRWPYRQPWKHSDPDPLDRNIKLWALFEMLDIYLPGLQSNVTSRTVTQGENFEHVLALTLYKTRGYSQYTLSKTENYV